MYQSSLYNTQSQFMYDPTFSQATPQLYQPHPVQQYAQQLYYQQQPHHQILQQHQLPQYNNQQQQYQQFNQQQQQLYNDQQQQYQQYNTQQQYNQQNDQDYYLQKQQKDDNQRDQQKQYNSAKIKDQPQIKQPTSQIKLPLAQGNAVQWMQKPMPIPGCPTGLEYLSQIDKLSIIEEPNMVQSI